MRVIEIELYQFAELSATAKAKAVRKLHDINVSFDWWNCIYEDAEQINLNITGFGLDRSNNCSGSLEYSMNSTIELIFENHGEGCKTVAIAQRYNARWSDLVAKFSDGKDKERVTEENDIEFDDRADELQSEFLENVLSEYADILQREYEHLIGDEAIIETITTNEYEFTSDGELH
jgi:hypothetical protein